jgi:hypothetical protein
MAYAHYAVEEYGAVRLRKAFVYQLPVQEGDRDGQHRTGRNRGRAIKRKS